MTQIKRPNPPPSPTKARRLHPFFPEFVRNAQPRRSASKLLKRVWNMESTTLVAIVLFCWMLTFIHLAIRFGMYKKQMTAQYQYGRPRVDNNYVSYQHFMKCMNDPECDQFPRKDKLYTHDYPGHPWHWSRLHDPDPHIGKRKDCKGDLYSDMYEKFHEDGAVVFESCSLKHSGLLEKAAEYTAALGRRRFGSDQPLENAQDLVIKNVAADRDTLDFIEYLHGGHRAFPFRTLNIPAPTQQHLHSDLIEYDTSPRTLYASTWLALQNMTSLIGPLEWVPGSHRYGTWDYDEIGLRHRGLNLPFKQKPSPLEKDAYGQVVKDIVKDIGMKKENAASMQFGQSVVLAAGTLHGGHEVPKHITKKQARLSQVNNYFFEGADFYWKPLASDLAFGRMSFLGDHDVNHWFRCVEPDYSPSKLFSCVDSNIQSFVDDCYETSFFFFSKKCPPLPVGPSKEPFKNPIHED